MIKQLLIVGLLLIITSSNAGVGGIAGGSPSFQKGSQIHFQNDSTWVNALYSRTLCHDNHDYKATVRKCAIYSNNDDRTCLEYQKTKIYQPLKSTRTRCKKHQGDECVEWVKVNYYQSPKRIIDVNVNHDNRRPELKKVVIPSCK